MPAWLEHLAGFPTLLLMPRGPASAQAAALLGPGLSRGALRAVALPWLSQTEFDHLLWSADLNFVRGEDSLVRALWAGAPFVWQLYPQRDGAHRVKLQAFLDLWLHHCAPALAYPIRRLFQAGNGGDPDAAAGHEWPPALAWAQAVRSWRDHLAAQPDLTTQLLEFAAQKR
jgi:uncharacterized repeat protein (TIGR03837 family)